ncbi:MAG: hypothetical protein HS107_14465 [Thermoflexaceae bacterium]|nr:hypothetical protein [Thermoflexaceae bacterium]
MNDEQSKRLSDAADAVIAASEALDEAREALADRRFDSELERERLQAAQQMTSKIDAAAKRIDDAVRKGTIAAAALARTGAYARYREAVDAVKAGRATGKAAGEQDGTANKRTMGNEALGRLDTALNAAAAIVFGG